MGVLLFATEGKQLRVFVKWSLKQLATFIFNDKADFWMGKQTKIVEFEFWKQSTHDSRMSNAFPNVCIWYGFQAGDVVKSYFFEDEVR